MASKKINILANVVMPILVYAATVGLALLFKPEETTALYWVNMVYLIVLETIFFGWLFWVRLDSVEVTPMFSIIMGTYASYYLMAGMACIIGSAVFSLFVTVSMKWYIATIIVITLLWIIPAVMMAQADSTHAENQAQVQDKRAELLRKSEERRKAQLGEQ